MSEKNVELKDEELEKVTGGFQANEDGTYALTNGESFQTSPVGHRFVYVIQGDYDSVSLDTNLEVYFMELSNGTVINDGTKIISLRDIFESCDVDYSSPSKKKIVI